MTINCKGTLISLERPKVMGILNATPDSFYENSRITEKEVLKKAEQMLIDGADFLDIGGYSSRPNADDVLEITENKRVIPIIRSLVKEFPNVPISIDTFRSEVARQSLLEGAAIINDISAGQLDEKMWNIVAEFQVPYIVMHLRGTPQSMREFTDYKDIISEIIHYFSKIKAKAQQLGINDCIIDPGFGFSKNLDQNYEVLQKMELLQSLDAPILVGFSRKSMLYNLLETDSTKALNATTVVNTIALMKGASILRVHDVKEAKECVQIFNKISDNE